MSFTKAASVSTRISVIVPNRNGGDTLLDTLECIIASAPADTEVWLVDDGSMDGSPSRAQAVFPDVHLLAFDRSSGAAFARNQGLRIATGDYLFCIDADVMCLPECLPKLYDALQTADIVFPKAVSPAGDLLNPCTEFARCRCLNSMIFGIRQAAMAHMDTLFDETIETYGEDSDFFLRAHRLGLTLRYVPEAQVVHPRRYLLSDRHYYLTVRNAIYVWLKLRGLVSYWMPMDLWIGVFLVTQLAGALCNRSLGEPWRSPPVRYTCGSRLHLVRLFVRALAWNVRHLPTALARRRAFLTFLAHEHSHL
jgi:glycosyltransferase involved in cell wall biosynthesis